MSVVLGIILALMGLILLAVGGAALVGGIQQKKRCTASASGSVIAIHMEQKPRGRGKDTVNIYTPEFRFNADGVPYSYRSNFGSMRREFQEGQTVTICYDPADPANCFVADDPNTSAQGGIMCLIIGALLVLAAVALFV